MGFGAERYEGMPRTQRTVMMDCLSHDDAIMVATNWAVVSRTTGAKKVLFDCKSPAFRFGQVFKNPSEIYMCMDGLMDVMCVESQGGLNRMELAFAFPYLNLASSMILL